MNKYLKIYLTVIITTGIIVLAYALPRVLMMDDLWGIALFGLLSLFSEYLAINMKHGSISVGFAINLATLLIFGPYSGIWVAAIGMMFRVRKGKFIEWYKTAFNMSALAITAGVSGFVYIWAGGEPGELNLLGDLLPILFAIFTYFFVNNLTMTIVMALAQKMNVWTVWKNNLRWLTPNYLALASLGILISGIYINLGSIAIVLFFIPLALARQSFKMYLELKQNHLATVQALVSTIEAKDPYTKGHSERVAKLAAEIARTLNLSEKEVEIITYAGYLHDVGKVSLEEKILNKPGTLNEIEYNIVKEHPLTGANIINKIQFLTRAGDYVKYHHERYDGSGYPEGLKEDQIPLGAAILAVADVYDAMTSDRPYRKAWQEEEVLEMFKDDEGRLFNPKVVNALLKIRAREEKVRKTA